MTPAKRRRLLATWLALAVALAVALFIGASPRARVPSAAQRAQALETQLRCPSCEDVSVADSSAAVAVAIKGIVEHRVAEGQSDAAIEAFLVSRYGEGILLRPPASGATAAVWVVPLVAVVVALVALAGFLWRRRRLEAVTVSDQDHLEVERALAERAVGG